MFILFQKGGLIMWPLLMASIVATTVVIERFMFLWQVRKNRNANTVGRILANVERGDLDAAIKAGEQSNDYVVRVLVYGLTHREKSFSDALLLAANQELKKFSKGLTSLDTIITLAPLLGLLGTVTGMIRAFGLLGNKELEAPTVITGGISEALIATAFGLLIAIIALIPFNYLNARMEDARRDIEDAASYLELLLVQRSK